MVDTEIYSAKMVRRETLWGNIVLKRIFYRNLRELVLLEDPQKELKWLLYAKDQVLYHRPDFPQAEIKRILGGRSGRKLSRKTENLVSGWIQRLRSMVSPRVVFSIHSTRSVEGPMVRLTNGVTLHSAKLKRAVSPAEFLVCFVATVGNTIEEQIRDLTDKGKMADAFVVDAIGSAAAEAMVDRFHSGAHQHAQVLGYGSTLRFSPGYCDWSVREQIKLFRLVDSKPIGVSLSPSALMTPRKSVSGVFGLTSDLSPINIPYNPCLSCGKKDCYSRRRTA
jgi:hypothetical protein